MTMPALNYIEHECTMQCDPDCNTQGASYIRSDIVEELAEALRVFMMSAHDYQSGLQEGEYALARYHEATDGK